MKDKGAAFAPDAKGVGMTGNRARDSSLDMARGLIMVLMALDHTRMFFTSAQFDPVAVDQTTLGYFITRWITHLCAPGFFFLAGMGAALAEQGGLSSRRSTIWLVTRGLWLMAIEFTLIAYAWSFTLGWSWFGVIWTLGASMVCLAALRWFPKWILGACAGLTLLLHNCLPIDRLIEDQSLLALLYGAGGAMTPFGPKIVLFPVIPWLAIMVLGYVSVGWLAPGGAVLPKRLAAAGVAAVVAFVCLRVLGIGQPFGGGLISFPDAAKSLMSFFNVEKYPPSAQFSLITLGVLSFIVALFAKFDRLERSALLRPLLIVGCVPFFFYVLHLYLIHSLALAAALAFGWPLEHLFWHGIGPNLSPPDGYGVGLGGIYVAWVLVLGLLYVPCVLFAEFKGASRAWWVKYL